MAKKNVFRRLIRTSPLRPLQDHMRIVCQCVHEIPLLFEALIEGDQAKVQAINEIISERESAADEIKNQLRGHLPNSLFLPVNRTDILQLLKTQDAIADTAEDIAGLLVARKMDVPEFLRETLMALANRSVDACNQSAKIIEELDELLAVGFQGQEVSKVEDMVNNLSLVESETDELGQELVHTLFEHEDEINPVSVVFWYQLIKWIGNIGDYAENVGDRVRLLIAR